MYNREFAPNGFVVVDSVNPAPDGDYFGFIVNNVDLVVTTAEFVNQIDKPAAGAIDGLTFKPGQYPMRLKNLTVSAGTAILYRN